MHQRQLCVQQRQKSHQCEHQDLYNQTPNDQINQREICRAPLYETSRSANSSQWSVVNSKHITTPTLHTTTTTTTI